MSRNRLMLLLGIVIAASMILTACGPKNLSTVPGRQAGKGGYLDQVVFSVVESSSAVTQLQAGTIDLYAEGLAAADLPSIQQAGLKYSAYNGLYYDILYNPAECNNGKLNPFADRKIREATNWLYDRNYLNQEIYAGGALPKWFAIQTQGPDYADLAATARELEVKYAYNLDKATQVIGDEMKTLGATQGADGKWAFNGEPVTLSFLIRPDSDGTRKPMGDYVASQLEKVGFTVDRQYKKSSEAGPIWQNSEPANCELLMYTAAWSSTVISRDEKNIFQEMYLPDSLQGLSAWMANKPDAAFQKIGDDLINAKYTSLDQRREWMQKALELSLQDSFQVFLIDGKNFAPYKTNVQITADLAAGVESSYIWPYTAKFTDHDGGVMKIGVSDLFTEPFNPIAGDNWTWDQMTMRATSTGNVMPDPFTGLYWPLQIQKADVIYQKDLIIGKTLDYITLKPVDKITVPADAWVDWDATKQTFITAGEKFPQGLDAKVENINYYPNNLFNNVTWHDGSKLDMADFIMSMIMTFDRANQKSAIYDEQAVPNFQSFQSSFKAFRITSQKPLTIEYYTDVYQQDAELNVNAIWPSYTFGEAPWDTIAIANLAEADGKLAWSGDKATAKSIEQTSFVGGPSLAVLATYLDQAIANKTIPYAPTLSKYLTAAQAVDRYTNLKNWYAVHGHFYLGTGPYYYDKLDTTGKTITMSNYGRYPFKSDQWASFGEPKLAAVDVTGPTSVKIGDSATFNVSVSYKGSPYPAAEIKAVKFLVYDATNAVIAVGDATKAADGKYTVTLGSDITSKLAAGANRLEVAVVPIPVTQPTFKSANFQTAP